MNKPAIHLATVLVATSFAAGVSNGRRTVVQAELDSLLNTIEFVDLDDGGGGTARTLRFMNTNIQLVNGLGATNGAPADDGSVDPGTTDQNGLGNVIVGYGEVIGATDRTGSHTLFAGLHASAGRFGAVASGRGTRADGAHATVLGGRGSTCGGDFAAASGGRGSTANGEASTVTGGYRALALGPETTVLGGGTQAAGLGATATGDAATAVGGSGGDAVGPTALVVGGIEADGTELAAGGDDAVLLGGDSNAAQGDRSTVLGGASRTASVEHAVLADNTGSGDGWLSVQNGGETVLVAQADRVVVGGAGSSAPLHVDPASTVDAAAHLVGSVRVGQAFGAQDEREQVALRTASEDWLVGASNDPEGPFEVISEEGGARLSLSVAGDLGLGTSDPQAAVHLFGGVTVGGHRTLPAQMILESATGEGETFTHFQTSVDSRGRLGFDERISMVLQLMDADRPGAELVLDRYQSLVSMGPRLEVDGTTIAKNVAARDGVQIDKDVNVGDHMRVGGDMTLSNVPPSVTLPLVPHAWGSIGTDGSALSGSGNWSAEVKDFLTTVSINDLDTPENLLVISTATHRVGINHNVIYESPNQFIFYGVDNVFPNLIDSPRGYHFVAFLLQ